jgi:hypothetical protein
MFAAKDCMPQVVAASRLLAPSLLATSSEFSGSAPEPCKMNFLCFDIDAKPFCHNPFILISIQNTPVVYPLPCIFGSFSRLQTASSTLLDRLPLPPATFSDHGAARERAVRAARANHDTPPGNTEAALTGVAACALAPAGRNLSRMNTYAKCAANPCGIRTSKIMGLNLKPRGMNTYKKWGGGEDLLLPSSAQ